MLFKQTLLHPAEASTVERCKTAAEAALLACAASCLLYLVYYLLSPYIWAQNPILPLSEYTEWIRDYALEHDGYEVYALYLLLLTSLPLTVVLAQLLDSNRAVLPRYLVVPALVGVSGYYLSRIGFTPPMAVVANGQPLWHSQFLWVMVGVALVTALLYQVQCRAGTWLPLMAAVILLPVCFIATQPTAWEDSGYIFTPALRLLNGVSPQEIYFQYDLFLSLLAAVWMKLDLDINKFQVLGQCSFYALFLGILLLSRQLFINKGLALFLFLALVLVKIYGLAGEPVTYFQVTPLRLDLWFPLLLMVYAKGPYHWANGLYCGFLVLFHHNFGIIYSAAFCQLLLTMYALDYLDARVNMGGGLKAMFGLFRKHAVTWKYHVVIIGLAFLAHTLLIKNSSYRTAQIYQKTGFGFIKIAPGSFYWYVPVVVSLAFFLLLRQRQLLTPKYLTTGLLLLFLAIGNSVYFFGRSHENNIINISATLLFALFLLLDLVGIILNGGTARLAGSHAIQACAALLVLGCGFFYANVIAEKTMVQYRNARAGQTIYPQLPTAEIVRNEMAKVRMVTGNSSKVYFLSFSDFMYYYYGNYAPVGYFNPFQSWVMQKHLTSYLQGLVDNGYFLVVAEFRFIKESLRQIPYNRVLERDGFLFLWNANKI